MNKNPKSDYKIRFNDCDLFGHLNNARYIDYFMNAREDHLKDAHNFDLTTSYNDGIAWVVTHHEIAYLRSAVYNEMVTIQTTLLKAESDSLWVEMVMTNQEENHIKAIMRTTFTPVNPKTGRKEQHTAGFMEWAKTLENTSIPISSLKDRIKEIVWQLKEKAIS